MSQPRPGAAKQTKITIKESLFLKHQNRRLSGNEDSLSSTARCLRMALDLRLEEERGAGRQGGTLGWTQF